MLFLPDGIGISDSPEAGMVRAKNARVEITFEGDGFGKDV